MSMSLLLGLGAYARDKNTSAILCAKKAGGFYARGGVYLRDTTACHRNMWMRQPVPLFMSPGLLEGYTILKSGKYDAIIQKLM